jgi:hypothetical protein
MCRGYWLGLNAIKVAPATILMRYRIAVQNTRIDYRIQPIMRPTSPVPAMLHPQGGMFAAVPISGRICNVVRLSIGFVSNQLAFRAAA